ncbi:hypothetical protein LSAT2_016473 [Lamellibrachia satsuma]|nr:hypothetical protein LSAT2_016473 [Lamellibrachia satsuma]
MLPEARCIDSKPLIISRNPEANIMYSGRKSLGSQRESTPNAQRPTPNADLDFAQHVAQLQEKLPVQRIKSGESAKGRLLEPQRQPFRMWRHMADGWYVPLSDNVFREIRQRINLRRPLRTAPYGNGTTVDEYLFRRRKDYHGRRSLYRHRYKRQHHLLLSCC